ncbi:helix-turn-helix transcriptional regulator [Pseudomonas sp.]|uniref:helix-turn-helix transcriptional regulator n=1 Tax=Pseudomonas sp. TaxID=306 RepID=UPI0025D6822D|nr:helix-turn-helix transcriptional regulator [Pseudomonas sp.]
MAATKKRNYVRYTIAANTLLGSLVQMERKLRTVTAQELADRLGIDRGTVQRLEKGNPKVELGIAFEACALLGIPLFVEDDRLLTHRVDEIGERLALLPKNAPGPRSSISAMTSKRIELRKAFVWTWLPKAAEPVVAGRLVPTGEQIIFAYGRSYLDRSDAIPLYLP